MPLFEFTRESLLATLAHECEDNPALFDLVTKHKLKLSSTRPDILQKDLERKALQTNLTKSTLSKLAASKAYTQDIIKLGRLILETLYASSDTLVADPVNPYTDVQNQLLQDSKTGELTITSSYSRFKLIKINPLTLTQENIGLIEGPITTHFKHKENFFELTTLSTSDSNIAKKIYALMLKNNLLKKTDLFDFSAEIKALQALLTKERNPQNIAILKGVLSGFTTLNATLIIQSHYIELLKDISNEARNCEPRTMLKAILANMLTKYNVDAKPIPEQSSPGREFTNSTPQRTRAGK